MEFLDFLKTDTVQLLWSVIREDFWKIIWIVSGSNIILLLKSCLLDLLVADVIIKIAPSLLFPLRLLFFYKEWKRDQWFPLVFMGY